MLKTALNQRLKPMETKKKQIEKPKKPTKKHRQ